MRFFWAPPSHPLPPRPPVGWLRAIRETLGMTSAELGQRLAITASGLRKLQQAEAADAIRLATLRRVAEALDCELNYALVPRQPLRQMRRQQTCGWPAPTPRSHGPVDPAQQRHPAVGLNDSLPDGATPLRAY